MDNKPGWKTTEFWLNLLAMLVTGLLASGAITHSLFLQIAGGVASSLAALGYTGFRTWKKTVDAKAAALSLQAPPEGK